MKSLSKKLEEKERNNTDYRKFKIDNLIFPIKYFLESEGNQIDIEKLKTALEHIKEICPRDPDIQVFNTIISSINLKNDRSEQIDQIMRSLLELKDCFNLNIKERILSTDKNKLNINIQKGLERLESSGINDTHEIVISGKQNAPCVILFLQTHSATREINNERTLLDTSSGVDQSQEIISSAIDKGVSDTLFLEGFPFGKINFSKEKVEKFKQTPAWNRFFKSEQRAIEVSANEGVKIRGIELTNDDTRNSHILRKYRNSSCNILIGSVIALGMDVTNISNQAAITIGSAHEKTILGISPEIRLSEILAHYGMDVIIVDTSTRFMNEPELISIAINKVFKKN